MERLWNFRMGIEKKERDDMELNMEKEAKDFTEFLRSMTRIIEDYVELSFVGKLRLCWKVFWAPKKELGRIKGLFWNMIWEDIKYFVFFWKREEW